MSLFETGSHSFIVKIWLEETKGEAGKAIWRGHITHVASGTRRYLRRVDDIPAFIVPYMQRMGVTPGLRWRVRLWITRLNKG